jgi:hypothetical protein
MHYVGGSRSVCCAPGFSTISASFRNSSESAESLESTPWRPNDAHGRRKRGANNRNNPSCKPPRGAWLLGALVRSRHARLRPLHHYRCRCHRPLRRRTLSASGIKRYGDPVIVRFGNRPEIAGFSFTQLIETSLISGHLVDASCCVFIDIFSCAPYSVYDAEIFTRKYFRAAKLVCHTVDRFAEAASE